MDERARAVAGRIGRVGVWCSQLQWQTAAAARAAVGRIERLGFGAVWIGEATGKEALTHAALLLGGGSSITVATGIASIWARDPMSAANASRTLEDAYPGRFLLGLGASHPFLTEYRDRTYERPYSAMRAFLEAMDRAPYVGPPADPAPRVLAALGPRMLGLARDGAAGAHPYFVPVAHTARARGILGPQPLLAPEQAVALDADPAEARRRARAHMRTYLALPNYANNLRALGWAEQDLAGDGSDALVDALVACGPVEATADRVRAHLEAGADHVAVRVLTEDPARLPIPELTELAAALGLGP